MFEVQSHQIRRVTFSPSNLLFIVLTSRLSLYANIQYVLTDCVVCQTYKRQTILMTCKFPVCWLTSRGDSCSGDPNWDEGGLRRTDRVSRTKSVSYRTVGQSRTTRGLDQGEIEERLMVRDVAILTNLCREQNTFLPFPPALSAEQGEDGKKEEEGPGREQRNKTTSSSTSAMHSMTFLRTV